MAEEPSTKRCSSCGTTKPRDEFNVRLERPDGLVSACKACSGARTAAYHARHRDKVLAKGAAYRAANRDQLRAHSTATNRDRRKAQRDAYAAALALVPLVESLKARVVALETLLRALPNGSIGMIAPERPRRKRAVHEHHTPESVQPSATPPVIRTIRDIIAHDGATAAEAKRIQEREILARAEWRPTGNA